MRIPQAPDRYVHQGAPKTLRGFESDDSGVGIEGIPKSFPRERIKQVLHFGGEFWIPPAARTPAKRPGGNGRCETRRSAGAKRLFRNWIGG